MAALIKHTQSPIAAIIKSVPVNEMHLTNQRVIGMHLRIQHQDISGIVIRQQTSDFGRSTQITLLGFINHQSHKTLDEVLAVCCRLGKINPANTRPTDIKSQFNRLPINQYKERPPLPVAATRFTGLSTPVLFTKPAHNFPQLQRKKQ